MSSPLLDGRQRRQLRALAHHLKPLVQVGGRGLTPGISSALDQALAAHELVKVRVAGEADVELDELAAELARATSAAHAQTIGKTLLFYRPHPDEPRIALIGGPRRKHPKTPPAPAPKTKRKAEGKAKPRPQTGKKPPRKKQEA